MFKGLQMQSTLADTGTLEVALAEMELPAPAEHEVTIRVEAAPINPSDLGVLFGPADVSLAQTTGEGNASLLSAPVPLQWLPRFKGRIGKALPVGNEGAGVVVAAGGAWAETEPDAADPEAAAARPGAYAPWPAAGPFRPP